MKKFLCLILSCVMLLGLVACGGGETSDGGNEQKSVLQVGFGKSNMMPETVVTIAGGEDPNRLSTGYLDYLTASCIAFSDGTNTVLLFTVDMQCLTTNFLGNIYDVLSKETGIPTENIMISCTHDHSSPSMTMSHTGISEFRTGPFAYAMLDSAKTAIKDLAPAETYIGESKTEGMVFVRHYNMEDGSVAGPAYGNLVTDEILGQAYESDETIQIVKFDRAAAGKKDIVLFNLGAHATYYSSTATTNLSADFPGPARDYVAQNANCHAAYFMSAAGDQTPNTRHTPMKHGLNHKEYGEKLGQYVVDALGSLTKVNGGAVKLTEVNYAADSNKLDVSRIGDAKRLWSLFEQKGYDVANNQAREEGFKSIYECRSIIMSGSYPKTKYVNINVLSAGDVSFAIFSGEMFSSTGRYIRENSPYDMTFVLTCANGYNGYFPDERGYSYGCYEAYSSYVNVGTAEKIGEAYINMLKEHKGQ